MKKLVSLIVIPTLIMFSMNSIASQPTCNDPKGTWKNELKSTLEISSIDKTTGMITGTYSSPSGTSGQKFSLIGWSNSAAPKPGQNNVKVISFSVRWGQYGSVTSWSGYCSDINGTPAIKTVWNLVRANSDLTWDHIITNSDIFTPSK